MWEWTDPKQADIAAAMRRALAARTGRPDSARWRVRGFVLPPR
jgi:hypothetical protein